MSPAADLRRFTRVGNAITAGTRSAEDENTRQQILLPLIACRPQCTFKVVRRDAWNLRPCPCCRGSNAFPVLFGARTRHSNRHSPRLRHSARDRLKVFEELLVSKQTQVGGGEFCALDSAIAI